MADILVPNEGESLNDFYNRYGRATSKSGWIDADINSIFSKLNDKFFGTATSARDIYNQWYNEQSAAKKAQADYEYTRLLNSTKYVDEIKAIEAAGLNPYTLLSNGGMSTGNMSYSSSPHPERKNSESKSSNAKALGAIAIIVSALIKALI